MLTALIRRAVAVAACGALSGAAVLLPPARDAVAAPADFASASQQWVLNMVDAHTAWNVSNGAGVTVAVIDSGVYPATSDIAGSVSGEQDYTGLSTTSQDPQWGKHGTWMASIIAGHGHDGGVDGIMGIAPRAKILSIRVIPDQEDPNYKSYNKQPESRIQHELAEGILAAVHAHAQVISMSIGYSAPSAEVRAAVQDAYSHGVVLVASSGNSGDSDQQVHGWAPVSFPAEYPGVLSVGAVSQNEAPTSFSSKNLSVKIAAPGAKVPAEGRDGKDYVVSGTSPACAVVAGVAALIKSKYPGIAPALVTQALISTARHGAGHGGYSPATGFGVVDAAAALGEAGKLVRQRPAGSQVLDTAHFGGGAAAVPAPPVTPRGSRQLALFALLALVSLSAAGGGLAVLRRRP